MLTPGDADLSPWVAWEQHQLYKQYERFAAGEPAYPRQFYTGNASVLRTAFTEAGGFDTSFRRAEDVELALRLARRGQSFVFEPGAEAHHYAERSLESWARIAFDYGRHDVDFARIHEPDILGQIAWMFSERHVLQRVLVLGTMWNSSLCRRTQDLMLTVGRRCPPNRTRRSESVVAERRLWSRLLPGRLGRAGFASRLLRSPAREATCPRRSARRSCSSRRSGTSPTRRTCSRCSRTITSSVPVFLPVDDSLDGVARRIPGWSNWTVRAGIRARRSLRRLFRSDRTVAVDAMFVHSQVPAILLGRLDAPDPDGGVARRDPDPIRRVGRVLRPRDRLASSRTIQVLGESALLRAGHGTSSPGPSGRNGASLTSTACALTTSP